jgi:hypothetical protein
MVILVTRGPESAAQVKPNQRTERMHHEMERTDGADLQSPPRPVAKNGAFGSGG